MVTHAECVADMLERGVDFVIPAPRAHWVGQGFLVHGYISRDPELARKLSPFLLLDYQAPFVYPPTQHRRGVGAHPHRGFETVTLAFEGSIAHHDSTGAGGVIGPGDVQWMTAGRGILHREYHERAFARAGGRLHMAQVWINLPAAKKMCEPRYQLLEAGSIGHAILPDDAGTVRVVAGEYAGVRGAAHTATPVGMLEVRLRLGGRFQLEIEATHDLTLLVMEGAVASGERVFARGDFVVFDHGGPMIALESRAPSTHLLVLSGEPIDEPLLQDGPFAMNTEREIRRAYADYRAGAFGILAP